MRKEFINILATITMLFTANISAPVQIFAADIESEIMPSDYGDHTYMGFSYMVDDNTVTITDCGDGAQHIDIPAQIDGMSVTCIDDTAFSSLHFLKSVTIPDSVTSIGQRAFKGCHNLQSVTIPDSVIGIGEYAFYGCSSLTNVTIGSGLTKISNYMFSHCEKLNTVKISDSVTSIGEHAFEDCDSLTGIEIPYSVMSIGEGAFYGCWDLSDVTIPDSVTNIGMDVFEACGSLESITVDTNNNAYSSVDGVLLDKSHTNLIFCPKGKSGAYVIPNGVVNIYDNAFSDCRNLTEIIIPYGITSIGDSMFYYCSSLESITIPNSVTSIGRDAFEDCHSLRSITIPDSVTSIEDGAFWGCNGLTSATIPDSVINIGHYAFRNCYNLADVYYKGTKEQWETINIGESNTDLYGATIHCNDGTTITPIDWDYTINSVTIDDEGVSVRFSSKSNAKGKLTIALYTENGTLVGTKCIDINPIVSNEIYIQTNTDHVAYVKAFIWEDMANMKPISVKKVIGR